MMAIRGDITNEPYEEYINRRLSESVQYKPKEEIEMEKYYNYEVEEEPEQRKYSLWDHIVYFFDVFLGWALLFITIVELFVVLALMVGII